MISLGNLNLSIVADILGRFNPLKLRPNLILGSHFVHSSYLLGLPMEQESLLWAIYKLKSLGPIKCLAD